MDAWRLVGRRARSRRGLLGLAAVVVALTAAAGAGGTGYATVAATDGLRTTLADTAPQDGALQIHTRLGPDPESQRAIADDVLDETLSTLPVTVHRTQRSVTLPLVPGSPSSSAEDARHGAAAVGTTADGAAGGGAAADSASADGTTADGVAREVVLGADAELVDHVRVVDGQWPPVDRAGGTPSDVASDAIPGAVPAHAATRLGLVPGDTFLVGDADPLTIVVAAVWEPSDADDPRWFGDPLVAPQTLGTDPTSDTDLAADPAEVLADAPATLVVVPADALTTLPAMVLTRWTLVPDAAALDPADLPATRAALVAASEGLRAADGVAVQGMAVNGGLVETLDRTDTALTAVRGVSTSLVLAVVLVAVVALSQVARLLGDVRARETTVLRARGTSLGQLAGAAAAEAAAVVVPSAAVGVLLAALALGVSGTDGSGSASSSLSALLVPLVWSVVLTTLGALALLTRTAVSRAVAEARETTRSGRATTLGAGALGLAAVAAGLAWWQLTRYGSPTFVGVDGRARVDPLAALALPLALLTIALLAVALLGPTATGAARRAERRPDLMGVLVRRQLARRTPVHAVTAALVALAVATGTFAAVQVGTWQQARDSAAVSRSGADVRVVLPVGTATDDVVATYRALPGVEYAVAVRTVTLGVGRETGRLVAVPEDGVDRVLLRGRDLPGGALLRTPGETGTLPLVLSQGWATDLAVDVGGAVRVRILGRELEAAVVGVAPGLPGTTARAAEVDRTALVDLDVLAGLLAAFDESQESGLRPVPPPNEVWLATTPTSREAVASAAAALSTTRSVTTATPAADPLSAPVVVVAWLVAACALLLAVTGIASALAALAQSRRDEVAVLRALGAGAREQARARGVELARVAGGGAFVGALGGGLAGLALAPTFVRSTLTTTAPPGLPVPPAVSVAGLLVLAAALAGTLVLVGLAHGARVRRQAATSTVRDEGR